MMDTKIKDIVYSISKNESQSFLEYKRYYLERDVHNIISIVFNIETALRMKYEFKEVDIEISAQNYDLWPTDEIEKELNELIKFVTINDIKIRFVRKNTNKGRRDKKIDFKKADYICLFSGGVDSSTGILKALEKYGESVRGLFVCHGDQGKINRIINNITETVKKEYPLEVDTMHAPMMHSFGYSQLRGLLYVLFAAIQANLRNAKGILVTECGPTMYQPRFSPFDSITMTTHPYIMSKAKKLMKLFFDKDFEIITPFENLTKAEIISLNPMPQIFPMGHSCIGARWIDSGKEGRKNNDGICYGCVVRRLGFLTAGITDTDYEKNPLIHSNANQDSLMNLLSFSTDILINYENMEYFSKEIIEEFDKKDMFKRFALDNISALRVMVRKKQELSPSIRHFYSETVEKLGTKILDDRIREVRSGKFKPNFDKKVV